MLRLLVLISPLVATLSAVCQDGSWYQWSYGRQTHKIQIGTCYKPFVNDESHQRYDCIQGSDNPKRIDYRSKEDCIKKQNPISDGTKINNMGPCTSDECGTEPWTRADSKTVMPAVGGRSKVNSKSGRTLPEQPKISPDWMFYVVVAFIVFYLFYVFSK